MQIKTPDINSMWGCMFAGDIEIKNVHQKSIFIVGNSRIGKSTFFNYISGVRLRGKQFEETGEIVLETVLGDGIVAQNTLTAVTLVPNLSTIYQDNKQVGLIDTAGFGDQGRSYAGKFGVSYMLQKLFQNIEQVKFIICISHSLFEVGGIKAQLDSLLGFIDLLQCETLLREQDAAKKFYNSISLVFTKSRYNQKQYLTRLDKLVKHLRDDKNSNNEKRVLISILESVINNKRIGLFQLATDGEQLPKPDVLQKLRAKEKNWNFYSFKNDIQRQSLIKMPFEKTFKSMNESDIELYKEHTTKKHNFIRDSFNLLKEFLKILKENWYEHQIDLSNQFYKLQKLINKHPYGSFESIINFLQLEFTIPNNQQRQVTRVNLIQKFKQIYKISSNVDNLISNDNKVFSKILKIYKPCFEIFDICRKTFCKNRQQQTNFLIFMFISMRSLYQCQMQSKIHQGQSAGVSFIVTGILNQILPQQIWDLLAQFLIGFKSQTTQQTQAYEVLLLQTLQHINELSAPDIAKKLIQRLITIYLKKADKLIYKQKKFQQALGCIYKISRIFKSYTDLMPQFDDMDKNQKAQIYFREIQILKKTGQCLQGLKLYKQAINIYKHIEAVSIVMRCYQDWIKSAKKKKDKLIPMLSFLKFLQQYGKRAKLIELYEKMIDQFECFPQKVWRWKKKLANVIKQNSSNQISYVNKLQSDGKIQDISGLILQIQQQLQFFVENQDEEQEDIDQLFEQRSQIKDYDDDNDDDDQ